MPDVKKLITGFLILALGASTSAWILSGTNATPTANLQATESSSSPSPIISGDAFAAANATPQDVASLLASQSAAEAALDEPGNLTGALSNSLLNGIVAANPDGIQTDANNNQSINQPDDNAILAELQSNPAVSKISIPNWDIEAAEIPIHAATSASETNAAAYSGAVDKIFNDSFVQNGVQGMVNDPSGGDPANAAYVRSSVAGALDATAALQIPTDLTDFQKSLVKLLVYEKNTLSLAENANADPVKTSLIFQNERLKYNVTLNEFKNQFEKAQGVKGFSLGGSIGPSGSAGISFLNSILGVKTAHAQWLTFDAASFGQLILNYAKSIVLQILKNIIISFIQNKVLKWIQGSGAPMFVQNWADEMVNAAQMSAINAIDKNYACVNPTVFPRIQIVLNAIYKKAGNNACAAQFQSQLSSGGLKQFYNNFANGGFVTFGQTLMPSNDFYGGLFFTAQNAGQAAQQGQGVFSLKTNSQQGMRGVEKCADGSNPSGISKWCVNDQTGAEKDPNPDGTCDNNYSAQATPNNGKCEDGSDPQTNSPGQVTGQVFKTSMEGSPELVTAANDIVGLLNAALSSLLNGLASMAINAATGAANGAMNGMGSGSSNGSGLLGLQASTSTAPNTTGLPPQPMTCAGPPTTVVGASATFSATGGEDVNGGLPTYTWSAAGAGSTSGGGNSFAATYNATGTYNVSVTASTGSNASCAITVQ